MKFAEICGKRVEATPGKKGLCPYCGSEVIAKCGNIQVHHWAHKSISKCDHWWENETEWHRSWKNKFPEDWQEIVLKDELTGEKHIADVQTNDGFVLEFQYSPIKPDEQLSRESFYKKMVWVLNGARRKTDYKRFTNALENLTRTNQNGIFYTPFPEESFPKAWIHRKMPVFFDYENAMNANPQITKNIVWGILPGRQQNNALVLCVSKDQLVDFATNGNLLNKLEVINKFSRT